MSLRIWTLICVGLTPVLLGLTCALSRSPPVPLLMITPLILAGTALFMLHKGERGYALVMACSALAGPAAGLAI